MCTLINRNSGRITGILVINERNVCGIIIADVAFCTEDCLRRDACRAVETYSVQNASCPFQMPHIVFRTPHILFRPPHILLGTPLILFRTPHLLSCSERLLSYSERRYSVQTPPVLFGCLISSSERHISC